MHSKENFEIKLHIKDKDGKIIELNKKVDLEVNWEGRDGKLAAPKEVIFEKDGKEFPIIITELEAWKGWFKKRRRGES